MQRCATFLGQRLQHVILVHWRAEDKLWTELLRVEYKKPVKNYLTSPFIAHGLILLPTELFRIVISCKTVSSSMNFKFIHKILVIQEKFLAFFNLLRGPDITRPGAGFGPRVVHSLPYCMTVVTLVVANTQVMLTTYSLSLWLPVNTSAFSSAT